MPALILLATTDDALCAEWARQVAPNRPVVRIDGDSVAPNLAPGVAAVVVLDVGAESLLRPALARLATILVGEPRSMPFEQARLSERAKAYLSYEESARRLREVLPLVEEIAEKQSLLDLEMERERARASSLPVERSAEDSADPVELWDFFEAAIENLDSRDRLLAEFRRISRTLLRASHTVFFLREPSGYRADRGTSYFAIDDPIVAYFENHPSVVDGSTWEAGSDALGQLSVRKHLALWGGRMLVPVHDNGRLLGLIALGVRDDGKVFGPADRQRAVFLARLLRHCLAKSAHWSRLTSVAEQSALGQKYFPRTLVLAADESVPRHVPVIVRDLIGQVRSRRAASRVVPDQNQPFRASAGIVVETGGVWAVWDEASSEVVGYSDRERANRQQFLREIGLTLAHEIGNGLVSLATLRHVGGELRRRSCWRPRWRISGNWRP